MIDSDLQASSTNQPTEARLRIATGATDPFRDEDDRTALAQDLCSSWLATTSARADFNANLEAYTALYEMEVDEQNWPWENAANLVLPIIPAELDALKSRISNMVFVQRLVIVTAADKDQETQRLAPEVEQFYNAELRRIRADGKTPIDQFKTLLHLGLRDGGGPCDVLFSERLEPKLILSEEPKVVDNVVVVENGEIVTERAMTRIEERVAEVSVIPRLLKDWYLVPAESTSIQSALGQPTVIWMTEKEMYEKVKDGVFRAEDVEKVLAYVTSGTTDVARDPEGSYDKDAGGQIGIGQGQGSLTSRFFRNRGPARIIRYFSDQFDLNDDQIAEKNVFWVYPDTTTLLGWSEYEYVSGEWPTFMFSPFPRPDRPHGYSLVERLADITADSNTGRNQRRNYIDMCVMPLLLQREGDSLRDKDRAFYPGAPWTVPDVNESVKWFVPPQLTPDAFSDQRELESHIAKLTGQNAPALGAQSSGRRTATETKQQQESLSVRASDIANDYRSFLRAVMQFWHKLNIQYLGAGQNKALTTEGEDGTLTLTADILGRKFNIDIAGLADPTDANSRRQEILAALGVIGQAFPWILQDPVKAYELAATFFETFQWAGVERIIGTREEAVKRGEAMAAQMQAAAMNPQAQEQGAPA